MPPDHAAPGGQPPVPSATQAAPWRPGTLAVVAGRPGREPDGPLNAPLVLASSYHQGGPTGYARSGNPTWTALEDALGQLEGGTAVTFASGVAAVAAVLDLLPLGATVVAPDVAYSGTLALLAEQEAAGRLRVRRVAITDTDAVRRALGERPATALLWLESPSNPLLEVADLPALAAAGAAAGALVAVDNTFATPLLQRPLELGAHLAVHSVTKALSGHSDLLLGAVVSRGPELAERLARIRTRTGAVPGPAEAWLALRGLRTLALRVDRAGANAADLASWLATRREVAHVRYPGLPADPGHARARTQMRGFGSIVAFEVVGGAPAADRVVAGCRLWVPATSLGGVESTLERRRRWSAEARAVPEGLVRLSVGIEDVDDLRTDLAAALASAPRAASTQPSR